MKRFFQIAKKKKNKRRAAALWLLLVAIEIFCPVFCHKPVLAAAPPASATIVGIARNSVKTDTDSTEKSFASANARATDEKQKICGDECLCSAMAIAASPVSIQKSVSFNSSAVAFLFTNPVFCSLSPPDLPPKIS